MFSFNLNQSSTTVNYMAEFQDDGQGSHLPSLDMAAGRAPPFIPCPGVFSILHDQGDHGNHRSHRQEEANDQSSNGVTIRCRLPSRPQEDDAVGRNLKLSSCDHYVKEEEEEEVGGECAWMPSKMRIMRKMMNADRSAASRTRRQTRSSQDRVGGGANHVFGSTGDGNISPSGGDVVRVCSDCHTTKTPLWRTGPCGPKSLCNACGIRQRKARRAMAAAAAAAANGSTLMPSPAAPTKARKEKKPLVVDDDRTVPFKKRCKFAGTETASQAKLDCFEDVTLTLGTSSTSSSTHRPFPQDERDAAILLMALSYGLVRS